MSAISLNVPHFKQELPYSCAAMEKGACDG